MIVIQEWWGLVLHTYPNADHAFFNDARPEVYDAAAAKDAWTRTLAFFRRELNG